ncbi:MAG: anhydro-N-acetylmuramic acid kinase, partial [Bacteroidota bacterium]
MKANKGTPNKYQAVGMMSGTSLDGADVAICEFWKEQSQWRFSILQAKTFSYPKALLDKMRNSRELIESELIELENALSSFWGICYRDGFSGYKPLFCAVHGQTVFHEPDKGITRQLCNPSLMADLMRLPVVCDFRSEDVRLGGQGAPLAPMGDFFLFSEMAACINLGGFANIAYPQNLEKGGYDITVCNHLLNKLAAKRGLLYDEGGQLASKGKVKAELLIQLRKLDYYQLAHPKSLGYEWFDESFMPVWNNFSKGV